MGKKAAPPPAAEVAPPHDPDPAPVAEEIEEQSKVDCDFIFPDGAEYHGQYFRKGEEIFMHGDGCLQSGPEVFQGQFEMGQYRHGTFKSCSGSTYKGWFRGSLYHGYGEYVWPDGQRKYSGMWADGQMHGRGSYSNFLFGQDVAFKDYFTVRGRFASSARAQEQAKQEYLAAYCPAYAQSATAALMTLATKAAPAEPVDPKKKGKAAVEEDAGIPEEVLRMLLFPHEDASPEAADTRAKIEQMVSGPFPDAGSLTPAVVAPFVAAFGEAAESPGSVTVYESNRVGQCGRLDFRRLHMEQLAHIGQVVEFCCREAEPGALLALVFVNIGAEYDVAAAKWKLIHLEMVPALAGGGDLPPAEEKKGKK